MPKVNPQADVLNEIIKKNSPIVYDLLSKKGQRIFFPKGGILKQGEEAKEKGKEINATLGTAYQDNGDPMVLPSVSKYLKDISPQEVFPYASSRGIPKLRHKWKEWLSLKNRSLEGGQDFSLPVVSCGLTHGLSTIGYLFVEEEDTIILADLFWGNYKLVFENAYGANLQTFRFFKNGGLDIDALKEKVQQNTPGKKIVLLNFPNNPSGYSPLKSEVQEILDLLRDAAEAGNKLLVVLDDAYFGLAFEENVYEESLFGKIAQLHENILVAKIDGVTKEEYAWGFRVGFITYGTKGGGKALYEALEDKTAGAVRGSISNAPHLSQSLILKALESNTYLQEKKDNAAIIGKRYDKVHQVLREHPEYKEYFEALPFNSGYFMCVKLKGLDGDTIRRKLLDDHGVGVISINDLLRIAFAATPAHKIEHLFDCIYRACKG